MEKTITSCSIWVKGEKKLRLFSSSEDQAKKTREFFFTGYNPFPCYSMESTFHIVAAWLKANGWERQPGGFITTSVSNEYNEFGEKFVNTHTVVTRFVPVTK